MTLITRRTALGALGSLIGLGLTGAVTLVQVDAKKHKKKKNPKKGNGNGGGINNPGGNPPPPPSGPQFQTVTRTFTQPDAVGIDVEGPSKQYPSQIVVDDLAGGAITKVTVRIPGFQHDFPDDVDMMLVGPQGQDVLLMSDAGGNQDGTVLFDLTFDDAAGSGLPEEGPLSNGIFRPTNFSGNDEFEVPAPRASGNTSLSVFNGTDPAGRWDLFIMDDSANDGGVLIGGWSLTITAKVPV